MTDFADKMRRSGWFLPKNAAVVTKEDYERMLTNVIVPQLARLGYSAEADESIEGFCERALDAERVKSDHRWDELQRERARREKLHLEREVRSSLALRRLNELGMTSSARAKRIRLRIARGDDVKSVASFFCITVRSVRNIVKHARWGAVDHRTKRSISLMEQVWKRSPEAFELAVIRACGEDINACVQLGEG